MKHLSRVVWSEGMHLAPHHFQVQSRYFEDSIQFVAAALYFAPYGLIGIELDAEALRNGTLSLLHARGILPDGLPFHMPDCDPLPAARNITDLFPPTRDRVKVLLAIPKRKPNGANCAQTLEESGGVRYITESKPTPDETTGGDEKPVPLGRKNFALLLDTEAEDEILGIPIAAIKPDGTGHFIFDTDFIPPLASIAASNRLMQILGRLIEMLDDKSASLSRGTAATGRTWAEYSTRDVAQFWLLHTVNSALAPLRDIYTGQNLHPERLFAQMLRLAGALCTFSMESHPRDLPLYDHNELAGCFSALEHHIRLHLETVVPTNVISISLEKSADCFYSGEITDQGCLDRAHWIFAIRCATGDVDIISKTPHLVKICSKLFVPKLVERALPGLDLTHLPNPLSAISAQVDVKYFSITRSGPCWEHIVQTRQVGIYVPGELPDPDLQLLVILES